MGCIVKTSGKDLVVAGGGEICLRIFRDVWGAVLPNWRGGVGLLYNSTRKSILQLRV